MLQKHIWKPVSGNSSTKPSPRWGHSCCVIGEEIVLFGGYAGKYQLITDYTYMNDIWSYHTELLQWTQIKTFGALPSQRSNSSLHYDFKNNRIVMFGGGGPNKTRFNTISFLDWQTKIWTQFSPKQHQSSPKQRTYHSSELLYPYLIVYGGEGEADLDDLWVFDIQTMTWIEVSLVENSPKPCLRRFHSTCLIGNQFFVIAGCHSKYIALSDVYSIDLTNLANNKSFDDLQWKKIELKNECFLGRWGHGCASFENKIYIFGGRFSKNDLNDILVIDMETNCVSQIKTPTETIPKPRRRACMKFIGSCLLMFGGYNKQYYNDFHFINVYEGIKKPRRTTRMYDEIIGFINNKETSDSVIETDEKQSIFCHKSLMLANFENQQRLSQFLLQIKQSKQNVLKVLQLLYKGFGQSEILDKYQICLPASEKERDCRTIRLIQELCFKECQSILNVKVQNTTTIQLSDCHYENFIHKSREKTAKCKFFKSLVSKSFKAMEEKKSSEDISFDARKNEDLVEIVFNFLTHGFLIVPNSMKINDWMNLYEIAKQFGFEDLKQILVYSIWTKVEECTVDFVFNFSIKQNLNRLSYACARFQIKNLQQEIEVFPNMYIEEVYKMSQFEIKQKMWQNSQIKVLKKKAQCT